MRRELDVVYDEASGAYFGDSMPISRGASWP